MQTTFKLSTLLVFGLGCLLYRFIVAVIHNNRGQTAEKDREIHGMSSIISFLIIFSIYALISA